MKTKLIIGIIGASAAIAAAQQVKFRIEVVDGTATNNAVVNITNAAVARVIIDVATNTVPGVNAAQALRRMTRDRLMDSVNKEHDRRAEEAIQAAADAARNQARAVKTDDVEK